METALAVGITYLVREGHLTIMDLLEKMTLNPARLYGISSVIAEGKYADLVIFDIDEKWTVDEFYSKSTNSPLAGRDLFGKVKYTLCRGRVVYQDK